MKDYQRTDFCKAIIWRGAKYQHIWVFLDVLCEISGHPLRTNCPEASLTENNIHPTYWDSFWVIEVNTRNFLAIWEKRK